MTSHQRPPEHRPAWWDKANNRAMVFARISDKNQKDGVSPEMQIHKAQEYAAKHGLVIARTMNFQESAKKSKLRRQFHTAIEEARHLRLRHLIFYMYDRVARNFTDSEILEEMIREGDFTLHVTAAGTVLHKNSDDSEFFLFEISIAQAKQDNRIRRRKTLDGMEQRCRNGWYPSRPPHFYSVEPVLDEHGRPKRRGSTVVGPTEEGRRLLRREMELHFEGYSLDRIREACLAEGLVPLWLIKTYRRSTVNDHLKDPFYAALPTPHDGLKSQFVWRDTWYEARHEPIFTADEWRRLQESFGLRAKYRKLKHDGLFAQGPLSLRCEVCDCKITYAPKTKPSGKTYHYYRCGDGKRIHVGQGEPQVNVLQEEILEQLGGAVDEIVLTPDLADAIARGLNETHREAMAAKSRAAEGYRAAVRVLEEKENRLFDRFDTGEIDRETYDRQLARIRGDKAELFERLRDGDAKEDAKYLVTAEKVLELAKRAKSLWESRNAEEKRDFVARLVCNPRLDGRTVRYDLRKPFDVLVKMRKGTDWRARKDSNFRPSVP